MLGHLGTAAFLKSPAGKAMDVLASGTPRRVLENLPMAYQMISPKGGPLSVTALGPTRARVNFQRDVLPCAYLEGLLEALLKKAGARRAHRGPAGELLLRVPPVLDRGRLRARRAGPQKA
ncbi:TIGR02265 family protein [Cystobacter fuscus]